MGKKLIPFDFEKAKAGAKIVFADYPTAVIKQTIIMHGPVHNYVLVIYKGEDGNDYSSQAHAGSTEFLIEEETKEYWINIYKNEIGIMHAGLGVYDSEFEAKANRTNYISPLATCKIEI